MVASSSAEDLAALNHLPQEHSTLKRVEKPFNFIKEIEAVYARLTAKWDPNQKEAMQALAMTICLLLITQRPVGGELNMTLIQVHYAMSNNFLDSDFVYYFNLHMDWSIRLARRFAGFTVHRHGQILFSIAIESTNRCGGDHLD
jgi:hypothetical protein